MEPLTSVRSKVIVMVWIGVGMFTLVDVVSEDVLITTEIKR